MALVDAARERPQAVAARRHRAHLDAIAARIEQAEVQPAAAEIQPSVQHEDRASYGAVPK
jgi:hypothetical protein